MITHTHIYTTLYEAYKLTYDRRKRSLCTLTPHAPAEYSMRPSLRGLEADAQQAQTVLVYTHTTHLLGVL